MKASASTRDDLSFDSMANDSWDGDLVRKWSIEIARIEPSREQLNTMLARVQTRIADLERIESLLTKLLGAGPKRGWS